ncbi:hypothetical protein GCM10011387_00310 [Pedobacter quisquiliarum]|uniref:Calcineurin-like phosphoesterase domain-containing protein n=1 Tax=Pedobacter quisquiliarum TaxID=1834438 RepID=A0A916TZ07_9SPHI|nr:metallophosphoesterase [Pedobacter quisquiliarum]GGC50869.1 hypothetical protein GCM10011387_00310 [Pedobacter quisquiliarum]
MKKTARLLKKLLFGAIILGIAYWVLTTLFYGHSNIDEKTGQYSFSWSGLNALWQKDRAFGFKTNGAVETRLDGIDGPYIIGDTVYQVTAKNRLERQLLDSSRTVLVRVNNEDLDTFRVKIQEKPLVYPETSAMPEKLIAISDIEGNFNGFYSFLVKTGVMNKDFRWTFGKGLLVLNGDFVDRGHHVPAVLWLIYHLEYQAAAAGGAVHYILGNHEILNMYGNTSYAQYKYREVARQISRQTDWDQANEYLYGEHTVIGKWLRSKHVMENIGGYIFVHAGLNKVLVEEGITQNMINAIARKYYGQNPEADELDRKAFLVLKSNHSPYWDRTLSMNIFYKIQYFYRAPFKPIPQAQSQQELEQVLQFYKGSKIFVGHSIVGDINSEYEGRVIKIDLKHGQQKFSGKTKGIMIHQRKLFKVDDTGNQALIPK